MLFTKRKNSFPNTQHITWNSVPTDWLWNFLQTNMSYPPYGGGGYPPQPGYPAPGGYGAGPGYPQQPGGYPPPGGVSAGT